MLCLQLCCNNGRDDISRSLSRDTVHTNERASVRSLPKASRSVSYHGPSMPCPRFSTFPSSCSLQALYRFLRWFNWSVCFRPDDYFHFRDLEESCRNSLAQGKQKTAEETALNSSSEIDTRAFMWTFDCLDEDHGLELFFSGVPGFRGSKFVNDPLPSLTEEEKLKLYGGLRGLLDRTFSSNLLSAPIKDRRTLICAKAVDPEHTPIDPEYLTIFGLRYTLPVREPKPTAFHIVDMILSKYQHSGPVATGVAKVLRGWGNNMHEDTIVYAQLTICSVLATSQPRDDSWYNIASGELGFTETSLREYATQGDSLSLVILIHVVRQQFRHFRKMAQSQKHTFSFFLDEASKLDATDTSSELQHRFCSLWNQIVREAQDGNDRNMADLILRPIHVVHLALHSETDSAPTRLSASASDELFLPWQLTSYTVCKLPDPHSDSTAHDSGVAARALSHRPRDRSNTAIVASITSPNPLPASTHAPLPVVTDALPLDNQISVPVSTQVIGQTTTEGHLIPAISPGPVIGPSRTTTSSPSPSSASQPADIPVGHSALSRVFSYDLNVRSSPSPTPILDAVIPTGLLSFQPATRSGLSFVYSSYHR